MHTPAAEFGERILGRAVFQKTYSAAERVFDRQYGDTAIQGGSDREATGVNAGQASTALEWLREHQVVVRNGATGTMLHGAGVSLDRCLPELNVSHPALVRDLHAAYVSAGAQIMQINTFGANRLRLAGSGLENSVSEINMLVRGWPGRRSSAPGIWCWSRVRLGLR